MQSARRIALIACIFLFPGIAAAAQPLPTATLELVGLSSERLERVTNHFRKEIAEKRVPGVVMLVSRKGRTAYLELMLRTAGVEHVFCSEVSTQAVVQACTRDAHDRDSRVTVLEDCCSAPSDDEHRASIGSLGMFATITTTDKAFSPIRASDER